MIKIVILMLAGMCLLTGSVTSTTASTDILLESDHSYANNFDYIWPAITQPGATQMRLHFVELDLDRSYDYLFINDKDGNELVEYDRGENGKDFWTDWFTGDTFKVRLKTNGEGTAYGFKIDQIEIRTNSESILIDANETSSSSSASFAYITNGDSDNVSVIDTATNTVRATVNVGSSPFGVAVTPDGKRVYVTNMGSNNVSVIDAATNNVTATVNVGKSPRGVAVSPDGTKIYVVNSESVNVSVIDTATNNVTATVNVGWVIPYGVVVAPDGKKVYVTSGGVGNDKNNVSIIDTATNNVTAIVNVKGIPYGVAVSPDGNKVYVAILGSDNVSVVDTATNNVTATINVGDNPSGVAVTPDGKKVYVTNGSSNLSVIDTANNTVIATVNVGDSPFGVAVTPDGNKVYVANSDSNNVSVIDTATYNVTATVPVGNLPRSFGQFIGGSATATTTTESDCKEIKDYLPVYTSGVNLSITNKVGNDILVVWTKADSKESVFKANILNEQTRMVTASTGNFDEYIRISHPQTGCSWYRLIQTTNDGHTQLESDYEYTVTYYWGSNGTGLTPISDSEAPE